MSKAVVCSALMLGTLCSVAWSQESSGSTSSLMNPSLLTLPAKETPAEPAKKDQKTDDKQAANDKRKGPTEITCTKETNFAQKPPVIVFVGDVKVHDPQFDLKSDKLTVHLKEGAAKLSGSSAPGASATPTPKPSATPAASPQNGKSAAAAGPDTSSLDKVIADGNVVIVASRPGENEGEVNKYVAKSAHAVFESSTGDITLTGWPQVQNGVNSHVATEEGTIMILNRDGRMRTVGRSKTLIQEKPDETTLAK